MSSTPIRLTRGRERSSFVGDSALVNRLLAAAIIAVVLAAAGYFRLAELDRIGLNSDEAVYTGQAGSLAGDPELRRHFSPFRAHPLLLQTTLAIVFKVVHVDDWLARFVVAVFFGIASVVAAAALARRLYGWTVGVVALVLLAVAPYHVLLSRQVMLDVPLALFLTLTVAAVHRFAADGARPWWFASALLFGLAVLAKETGILLALSIAIFLLWSGIWRQMRVKDLIAWGALAAVPVLPFAVTRLFFGGETTSGYLAYQAFRPPNHEWWYFPVVLWEFLTPALMIAAIAGLGIMMWRRTMADKLLLSWFGVFVLFFQLWPTKLFPYLIAVTPVIVIAGAIAVVELVDAVARRRSSLQPAAATIVMAALLIPLVPRSVEAMSLGTEHLEGPFRTDVEVQDFAGSREAASWIGANTPEGSVFLTIGPSIGNIVSFYGDRDWYALSVSKDPRRRNPAYRPVPNPDLSIRRFQIHYAVWDHYSADRSAFYNARLMRYVRKYSGRPVFSTWLDEDRVVQTGRVAPEDADVRVVVYDLVGGNPPKQEAPVEGQS